MASGITARMLGGDVRGWPLRKRKTGKQRTVDRRGCERQLDRGDQHDEDDEHHDQSPGTGFAPGVTRGGAGDGTHRGRWEEQSEWKTDEISESESRKSDR